MSCRRCNHYRCFCGPINCCPSPIIINGPTGPTGSSSSGTGSTGSTGPTGSNGPTGGIGQTGPPGSGISGGSQTLAETLGNGNSTSGNNIVMSSGDEIMAPNNLTMIATNSFNITANARTSTISTSDNHIADTMSFQTGNVSTSSFTFTSLNGGVQITALNGIINSSSLTQSATVTSNASNAVALNTTAGGAQANIFATLSATANKHALTSTNVAADSIVLTASNGGIMHQATAGTIASTALTHAITVTSGSASAVTLTTAGGVQATIASNLAATAAKHLLTSTNSASDSITLTSNNGGIMNLAPATGSVISMAATSSSSVLTFQAGATTYPSFAVNSSGVIVATAGISDPLTVSTPSGQVANFQGNVNLTSLSMSNTPVTLNSYIYFNSVAALANTQFFLISGTVISVSQGQILLVGSHTLTQLNVSLVTAPGVGNSNLYNLGINGVTVQTLTISGTNTTGSISFSQSTSDGDLLSIGLTTSGSPTPSTTTATLTYM